MLIPKATHPGTHMVMHHPDHYTPQQLRLLSRVVIGLDRGFFFYYERPGAR